MPEPLLQASDIHLTRDGRAILAGAEVSVAPGEIVSLIGPNGAGKTSLVRVLLGLARPDGGTVRRKRGVRIGYMPQRLHVDATMPLTVRRFLALAGRDVKDRIEPALAEVGAARVVDSRLHTVSGGEFQRVLLARALLRDPDVLVLDEPAQGVDIGGQADLYALVEHIRDRHGCGVVMVSHDLHLVMASTDRVICLNRHVCCAGHPEMVSRHPAYVELFGERVAASVAVYRHDHDHRHDAPGQIVCVHDAEELEHPPHG